VVFPALTASGRPIRLGAGKRKYDEESEESDCSESEENADMDDEEEEEDDDDDDQQVVPLRRRIGGGRGPTSSTRAPAAGVARLEKYANALAFFDSVTGTSEVIRWSANTQMVVWCVMWWPCFRPVCVNSHTRSHARVGGRVPDHCTR
jgi:hypothetical protein